MEPKLVSGCFLPVMTKGLDVTAYMSYLTDKSTEVRSMIRRFFENLDRNAQAIAGASEQYCLDF